MSYKTHVFYFATNGVPNPQLNSGHCTGPDGARVELSIAFLSYTDGADAYKATQLLDKWKNDRISPTFVKAPTYIHIYI